MEGEPMLKIKTRSLPVYPGKEHAGGYDAAMPRIQNQRWGSSTKG